MKTKLIQFLLIFFVASTFHLSSQEYDVLPEDGRNDLFHAYLLSEFDSIISDRKEAVAEALQSKESVLEYQANKYESFVNLMGEFPDEVPLNAEVVGTVSTENGYHIEKVVYETRPNHHVTANLYVPETGTAPYPTVIILCGHYPVAKTYVDYQNLSILFAKNGIAAFIIDPICQGERYQFHNSEGKLTWLGTSGTSALTKLDVGASLNGSSTAAHMLWDNRKGVDYLYTRTDVVDTAKIGCTGHSGGGAQATNLLAYEKRLKAGVVSNYITNESQNFKILQPQTAPQNLSFEGEYGFDTPDYITMFAPKPYMIIATTTDFFEIEGSRETFAEVQPIYDTLGAKEKVTLFETTDVHDYTKIKREAAVRWFKRWFYENNDTVIEADQVTLPDDTLEITSTGQVYTEYNGEMTVQDINLDIALKDSVKRNHFWTNNTKDSCLNMIKHLIRLDENYATPVSEVTETIDRDTYTIDKIKITSGNNVPVTGLLFKPNELTEKVAATLYVNGDGKEMDADEGGILEEFFVNQGNIVFAIDVRGFGETKDNSSFIESKHGNVEYRNAVISLFTGKTLIGQRVEDIMKAITVLLEDTDVHPDEVGIEAIGRAGTAVLHAAALDTRIKSVVLRKPVVKSYTELIEDPSIPNGMTHMVNDAMKYYDLPDLIEAMSPRTAVYKKSLDATLERMGCSGGSLSPKFSPNILEYEVTNLRKSVIGITGYLNDENATVTGNGDYDVSGESKTVEIVVTAEDGETTRTYTVTIPMYVSIESLQNGQYKSILEQNYPNPFNDISTIGYALGEKGKVSIDVFSIDGRKVTSLVNETKHPGNHEASVEAANFKPGVYYYQLVVDGIEQQVKRMVVTE